MFDVSYWQTDRLNEQQHLIKQTDKIYTKDYLRPGVKSSNGVNRTSGIIEQRTQLLLLIFSLKYYRNTPGNNYNYCNSNKY
jgi:hypothetical protein